jgi:hypothetical protein
MIDLVIEQRRRDLGGGFPVLGLVINPVAGMGGTPTAQDRARAALDRLNPMSGFCVVTASDGMGEAAARSANLEVVVVHRTTGQMTCAFDTMAAAQAMVAARADLILFVGESIGQWWEPLPEKVETTFFPGPTLIFFSKSYGVPGKILTPNLLIRRQKSNVRRRSSERRA